MLDRQIYAQKYNYQLNETKQQINDWGLQPTLFLYFELFLSLIFYSVN